MGGRGGRGVCLYHSRESDLVSAGPLVLVALFFGLSLSDEGLPEGELSLVGVSSLCLCLLRAGVVSE
jgi:hypothetical protein